MGWSMGWDDGHTSLHDDGRTFRRVRFEEYRIYDMAGEPYLEPPDDSRKVFLLRGQKLLSETVDVHSTDRFDVTEWESMYSSALTQGHSPFSNASFIPIVDDSYRVVGHVGWADGNDILVPEVTVRKNRQFWSLLKKQRLEGLRQWLLDDADRRDHGPMAEAQRYFQSHAPSSPPAPTMVGHCGYHPPGISLKPTIWDQARNGPLPDDTEDAVIAHLANLGDFLRGGGEVSVGRHFQRRDQSSYLNPNPHRMDGEIGSPKKPFSSGYEFLVLVNPEGHVQGVMEIRNNLKTEDEWIIEKASQAVDILDKILTVVMVIEVVPIAVALLRMGATVAKGVAIRAIRLVLDAAAKAALKRLLERMTEEALAKAAEKLGKLTVDEMIAHLTGIVRRHPELRRLMAARVLTEQRLTSATLEILSDWALANGRRIAWKTEAEMVRVTKDADNLMTLQGNELWINEEAKALKEAQEFYKEVVHELASDSLGYRGVGMSDRFIEMRNGMKFTDQTLLENAVLRGDIEGVVRFFAGE